MTIDKIYVVNNRADSVSVIDGYNDSKIKDIPLRSGSGPIAIASNPITNKIYVANSGSNSVSVIDGYNDNKIKDISLVKSSSPRSIVTDPTNKKIYVANSGSNNVTVIDGITDSKIKDIRAGPNPYKIVAFPSIKTFYVVNWGNNGKNGTLSIIDGATYTAHNIPVGISPVTLGVVRSGQIYVVNSGSNDVSVINGNSDTKKAYNINVGKKPVDMDWQAYPKVYVVNSGSNDVSVINGNHAKDSINVGIAPNKILYDTDTNLIYVVNQGNKPRTSPGTVSVINGHSDNVTAGVIFKVNPANSGKIICNNVSAPTNIYVYVDAGTNCTAQPNNGFLFNSWIESLPSNRNSSIPLDSSGNLTVNRYATFTVNFKPLPPPIPADISILIITVVLTTVVGWSIPSIVGWVKAKRQLEYLEECVNKIGKLDKNAIEEKIKEFYVQGRLSEDHRQFLRDKISEYYEK